MLTLTEIKKRPLNSILLGGFMILLALAKYYHEPWRDEFHSLCIALAAKNPIDLFHLKAYEGHPYLYYFLLYCSQIFGRSYFSFVFIHYLAMSAAMYLLLFKFSINNYVKLLLPFNYYLLFEFGTINRSYVFVILFILWSVYFIVKEKPWPMAAIFCLILAGNFHLQAIPICISLGLMFVVHLFRNQTIGLLKSLGLLTVLAISFYLAYLSSIPPDDCYFKVSEFIPDFRNKTMIMITQTNNGLLTFFHVDWFNFWNTTYYISDTANYVVFTCFIAGSFFLLNNRIRWYYLIALLGNMYFLYVLSAFAFRHFCFTWFAFLFFYLYDINNRTSRSSLFIGLWLFIQAGFGIFASYKDFKLPFSNIQSTSNAIESLHSTVPLAGYLNCSLDGLTFKSGPIYYIGDEQLETFTRFKNGTDMSPTDSNKFIHSVNHYLDLYQHGYIILTLTWYSDVFDYMLQHSAEWKCKLVYKTPELGLIDDENYEIYSIERK